MPRAFLFILILFFAATPVYAFVVINEVAWMGTKTSASDEWIELFSDNVQNLDGWVLATEDSGTNIKLKGAVSAGGFYLIERTDDNSVPDIKADLISPFGKGLSNDGEILILKDAGGNVVDRVDGSNGWPMGGDSDSKQTLQRAKNEPTRWITAVAAPRAENANYVKKVIQPKLPPPAPAAAVADERDVEENFESNAYAASKISSEKPAANGEYWWLLGGILGGAVLGLGCVIMTKWRKSP